MASLNTSSFFHDPLLLSRDLHVEMPILVVGNVRLLLFSSTSALLVSIAAAAVAAVFLRRDPLAAFPVIGEEWGDEKTRRERFVTGAKQIYLDGYKKVCVLLIVLLVVWFVC